ncbi:Lar family restriction alleviation protein [Burkholderia cenocepacia]|uniref:Lar family restriction alleviation protein n=1 Tax=Burkholderia cenocepacia TaxID=95486 RepID=UPI00222EB191|nr:Lar family restriction alleviation protein [Burkholderia cenocepacia]MCW3657578.1 Lar family restriction alleviation protein [Burkholderia cenocepacia]
MSTTDNQHAVAPADLLPCPHCGHAAQITMGCGPFGGRVQVECASCRIATFWFEESVAVRQWNRRISASPSSQPAAAPAGEWAATFEEFRDRCEHYHGFKDETDDTQCTCPGNNHPGSWCEESDCPRRSRASSAIQAADERAAEASVLASILRGMVEGPAGDPAVIYEDDYSPADGDVYVARAAELLDEFARASSANETGAEGLAHEVWAAAQLAPGEGIEHGTQRIAAILSRAPAQAAEPVAIRDPNYVGGVKLLRDLPPQTKLYAAPRPHAQEDNRVRLTDERAYRMYEAAMSAMEASGPYQTVEAATATVVRNLLATPQPPAQADARVGLTDAQREAIEHAVLVAGHCRDGYLGDVLNSILAAHPGQTEPRIVTGDYEVDHGTHVEIRPIYNEPEPRSLITDEQRDKIERAEACLRNTGRKEDGEAANGLLDVLTEHPVMPESRAEVAGNGDTE